MWLQLLLVAFGLMTAQAAVAESVQYINRTFNPATDIGKEVPHTVETCDNPTVFGSQTSLSAGWYLTDATKVTSRVTVSGEVHIILADDVTKELTNGITTEPGAKLYIHPQSETSVGSGQYTYTCGLTLYGADNKAAIYVDDDKNNSNQNPAELHIMGGNITAKGGHDAAGIGANDEHTHGPIHINAGNINAKGGTYGAGIGGSNDYGANKIYIYGGNVTAVGGDDAAGIGGGDDGGGGICHLYGGLIKAYGGDQGAGIGGGADGHGGEVYLYAAMVEAQGGGDGAGVGGGYKGNGGKVVVHNGALIASGDFTHDDTTGGGQSSNGGSGAGIGGGKYGKGGTVIVHDGTVSANGGMKAISDMWQYMVDPEGQLGAGIGSGHEGEDGGSVTIYGGSVTATADDHHAMASMDKAHAIGGGDEPTGSVTFNLYGGTVTLGSADNVIGIDDGYDSHTTISIPDDYCVKYTVDFAQAEGIPVTADLRYKYLRDESTSESNHLIIAPCTHALYYTFDADKHVAHCPFCLFTAEDTHDYDSSKTCTVCGYKDDGSNVSSATAYQATGTTDGGYETTGTTTMVINNSNYVLPACTYKPAGWTFAGWKVSAPAGVTSWAADGSTKLYKPGDTYKVTEDVNFIASFYHFESEGEGTEASPYLISTEDAMSHLAEIVNGGVSFEGIYFKLTADLNYSGKTYTPVGTRNGLDEKPFKGVFDGAGHKISGISIAKDDVVSTECRGVFGFIKNGVVKNLTIANSTITGCADVGGIVGLNYYGQIYNCHALSDVTLNAIYDYVGPNGGGIVGYNYQGKVEGCTSSATISGNESQMCVTGGIAGVNDGSAMNDCLYYGNSVKKLWGSGALVGRSLSSDGICSSYSHCLYNPAVTDVTSGVGHSSNPDMEDPVYKYRTVTSGTNGLQLNFANYSGADYAYEYDGVIRVKNVGLLYQNKVYAMGGATVKFAIVKPEGYTISNVTASAGNLTDNGDGTFTLVMPADADVTITATMATIAVVLQDNANNSETLAANDEVLANTVTISGRTFWKDGYWNTLCLPFDVTIAGSTLDGATVMELDTEGWYDSSNNRYYDYASDYKRTSFDSDNGTLFLYFKNATKIEAGKPYIVKWDSGTNITDPQFTSSVIDGDSPRSVNSADGKVSFIGIYDPKPFTANDKSILYLGSNNQLYWPSAAMTLNSFRAYFHVDLGDGGSVSAVMLNFDGETTGIALVDNGKMIIDNEADAWYTLDGCKLNGKPTARGVYIHGGRKIVVP